MVNLPKTLILRKLPDGYVSSEYPVTVGREYAVRGEMGSCVVIDTDVPGKTASVHWSRFELPPAITTESKAAQNLAELVLDMQMVTDKGLVARRLAREVLGITDLGRAPAMSPITTNGTTRLVPNDEPVFLLRGQDKWAAAAVRYWADMVEADNGDPEIVRTARDHADKMMAWPKKKMPDLPGADD